MTSDSSLSTLHSVKQPALDLSPHENVLCGLTVDLSEQLRFDHAKLVLTDQALLFWHQGSPQWQRWPLNAHNELRFSEHAGLVTLSLHSPQERLAVWHLTQQASVQAQRLVEGFKAQFLCDGQSALRVQDMSTCSSCGTSLPFDDSYCTACNDKEDDKEVSSWVLLRLLRFAKPYRKLIALGFTHAGFDCSHLGATVPDLSLIHI